MKPLLLVVIMIFSFHDAQASSLKTIEIDGVTINYADEGKGDSLLLIHGLGADLSRFEHNIDELSKTHRVVAFDLPGFGRSSRADAGYNGSYYVSIIEQLRRKLLLGEITPIGNSMGGWLSLLYAKKYPQFTRSLILIAPAFVHGLPESVTPDMLVSGANPKTVEAMQTYLDRVLFQPSYSQQEIVGLMKQHNRNNRGDAIMKIAQSLQLSEDLLTISELADVLIPTLIIHGESDGIVPTSSSTALKKHLPNANLILLPDTGHWPQWEKPKSVNSIILSFIKDNQ